MDQFRLSRNPSYVQQIRRRIAEPKDQGDGWCWRHGPRDLLCGDWSIDIGAGATVGAGDYPAKFSFNAGTASCTDLVVYNTSLAGSSTQATVVAFDNLYVGSGDLCGTAPSTYCAFNTGGSVVTSVTLSFFRRRHSPPTPANIQRKSAKELTTIISLSTLRSLRSHQGMATTEEIGPTHIAPSDTFVPRKVCSFL